MNSLFVQDLSVSYQRKPVLWNINLKVPTGKLVGILGPNGAGKSTLIKAIMGLIPIQSGQILILEKPLSQVRQQISYVPQRESVDWDFPASVFDVVLMGRYGKLGLLQRPRTSDKEIALDAIRLVGLENYKDRQISQLSGGQQQRVFLARALAQKADIYFMDEPFAGVDIATEQAIIAILRRMRDDGKTIFVVHHDLQTAPNYFDWLILLNMHLVASGATHSTFTSKNLEETYGSKLTILSKIGELRDKSEFPARES
ncbi:MAG: ABC transporter ATP-binding protein [Cytophagales bacterium]|nr:ABC transporter ATP-binding protein [Cytophagales bacterium]MDW8384627.1 ABC transporter ATP-binding protein [Flammeovirgaceae bacterium]